MASQTKQPDKKLVTEIGKEKAFQYQLELLKAELEIINQTIARCDDHTRATKNWAIVTWAGSIAIAIGAQDLRKYLILTAILPVLFWLMDARWNNVLRAFLFRQKKISEFLNDQRLFQSFEQNQLVNFQLYDPKGRQYQKTPEYKKSVSYWRSMFKYAEVSVFYIGLILISTGLGLFFSLLH